MKKYPRIFRPTLNTMMLLFLLLGSLSVPTTVYADSTITVATNGDNLTDDGLCSLREAIFNANSNSQPYDDCVGGSADDAIQFNDALGTSTITLGSVLPNITDTAGLTINGGGDITIDGNDTHRIIVILGDVPLGSTCFQWNYAGKRRVRK
jgi:CSLREA domain-containing protein